MWPRSRHAINWSPDTWRGKEYKDILQILRNQADAVMPGVTGLLTKLLQGGMSGPQAIGCQQTGVLCLVEVMAFGWACVLFAQPYLMPQHCAASNWHLLLLLLLSLDHGIVSLPVGGGSMSSIVSILQ